MTRECISGTYEWAKRKLVNSKGRIEIRRKLWAEYNTDEYLTSDTRLVFRLLPPNGSGVFRIYKEGGARYYYLPERQDVDAEDWQIFNTMVDKLEWLPKETKDGQ